MKTNYNISEEKNGIIYLDINILNDSTKRTAASFTINRASPLLPEENEKYLASIIRFTIPTTSQPLFLFFKDINIVSIRVNMVAYSTPLIFLPTEFDVDNNLVGAGIDGGVYNYQTFADMVNVAIKTSCIAAGLTEFPYMTYDNDTGKFTVFQPISWVDVYPHWNPSIPKLFFNNLLATYFVNFNSMACETCNTTNCDYLIICANNHNNLYTDENGDKWYTNKQQWNGAQYTNSLSNISIVSNLFPSPGDSLNNTRFQDNNFSSTSIKVISDFEIDKETVGGQRSIVQYQSQNNRYLDLTGNNRLYNLDFSFYVFYNELINIAGLSPYQKLILNPFEVISLKIMFKKKALNY